MKTLTKMVNVAFAVLLGITMANEADAVGGPWTGQTLALIRTWVLVDVVLLVFYIGRRRRRRIPPALLEPSPFVYVLEDSVAGVRGAETYTVYEPDGEGNLRSVCAGLTRITLKAFASYPEVRPALIDRWQEKRRRGSMVGPYDSNLGKLIAGAEFDHGPARMPEVVRRSVIEKTVEGA